ncbi:rhodanese-like domain-containing protein [Maritimibacter sp. UBA3975]|uniref:rhodanese-like domain-containing protein n=1 Tax=Maritimibacter sp. UBA3975 TaxID=1946833 RepID=UPI0025B86256|nr:rhodanese-like domain-containing protein [Maritimibacter sp. UBA3975]
MAALNRRAMLIGIAGIGITAGVGLAVRAGGQPPFEQTFLTVDQMRETGGLIVDIRTPPEWAETGVIEDAVLLTFSDPERFLAQVGPALADGRDLILVCRSGNRTRAAAQVLADRIPNRIVSVEGGMKRVIASGYNPVSVN